MTAPRAASWPPDGGETGALIREFAWSDTALGPVEDWPPSLKTALAMVLNSPRAVAIYWGRDYLCLYNDAYRVFLGDKHPRALGRPAREVFPEAVDIIGPVFKRVMETGHAASEEQRMLPLERGRSSLEAWFTYTAEPIFDEDGRVAGILNPAAEIIELMRERRVRAAAEARGDELVREVESQRRAAAAHRESDDHFRRVADAAPALLWVTAPSGACTYLSQSWYEFTGRPIGTGLGFDWLQTVHPDDRQMTEDAFVDANARRKSFQLNHRVLRYDGEYRWVIDSGRPRFDESGEFLGYVGSVIDIDDHQRAEEQLREREERDHLFWELSMDLLAVASTEDGRWKRVNPAMVRLLGWSEAELLQMPIVDIVHPEDLERSKRATDALTGGEVPTNFEHRMRCKDGDYRWISWTTTSSPDRSLLYCSGRDVTDRHRAEEALRASAARAVYRARLSDVLRTPGPVAAVQTAATLLLGDHLKTDRTLWGDVSADASLVTIDIEHLSDRAANRGMAGTFEMVQWGDYLSERFKSGTTVVISDLDDVAGLEPGMVETFREHGLHALIAVPILRHKRLLTILSVQQFESREWTPEEVALVEETAERTWTAIERAQAERALRVSEDRFRRLAESMPQVVWTADASGRVEYYNSRGESYDGVTRIREGAWEWQPVVHPDDLERTTAAWWAAVESGEPYGIEHRIRLKDGTYRWHLSRAERVESGGELHWYGTSTDIHDLMVATEVKDRFLAIASHELRNPVGVIHGTAQQIRRSQSLGTLSEERFERYVESLLETSTHLANLTNDLTDVSRLQRGALPLNLEPMDVAALLREVAHRDDWTPRLHLEGADRPIVIQADRHRIRQVVTNLLDNALKYSSPEAPVDVNVVPDRDGVRIDVTDRGVGLSDEDLQAIFTPFGRASNAGTVPGLGMGLFIAREVAERHHGELHATSPGRGMGTTMSFWLPTESPDPELRAE